jgi:transcriptional regulator of acetoin/glycerol metabolism
MILASWQRSRECNVDFDRVTVPFVNDRDLETPLLRTATPILDTLHEQLHGEPVSIILTDQSGLVLDRRASSSDITARLDDVQLAPGFRYAEEFVGTNGIGTAISSGQSALVNGREHYAHDLGQFACAGAPIHHPTRRKLIGVLDLTSWAQAPGAMLMALAAATARQIEEELLAQTGLRELALFQEYMKMSQQSGGAVLAINNDVVMMNEHLRMLLDPPEQQALIGYAVDTMESDDRNRVRTVDLPSGRTAHLKYSSASSESGPAGGVFRVRLANSGVNRSRGPTMIRGIRASLTPPGLVGSGPAWIRCVQQVNSCYEADEWIAVAGEAGAGKRTLLRAVHLLHNPTRSFHVLEPPLPHEATQWLDELAEVLAVPHGMVVLAHADRLAQEDAANAVELILAAGATDPGQRSRVAITLENPDGPNQFEIAIPRTIEVPPLRHHIEDLALLVPHLLSQLPGGDRLSVSPRALAQLGRLRWPGNVSQLRKMLTDIARRRHAGVIELNDLPPEGLSAGRRILSPIEALERDAIVNALIDTDENPTRAATALGMSRATIYRKLRQYGISLPLAR